MTHITAAVKILTNHKTGQREVKAYIATAPDDATPYEYPFKAYRFGYWGKAEARKQARELKAELMAALPTIGKLTAPLEYYERWS